MAGVDTLVEVNGSSPADHSGAASSGGSTAGMNKKESSGKKKKTTKRKPVSSTSSESGKEEVQNGTKESTKVVKSSVKSIHVESKKTTVTATATAESKKMTVEKEINTGAQQEALTKNVTATTAQKATKTVKMETTCNGVTTNGVTNGVDHRKKTSFSSSQESVDTIKSTEAESIKPSVDRAKVTKKFNQTPKEEVCACKICGQHVYHMEKIKAEKSVFHKNCFRCKECGKALTVDSYDSNEGEIYCKLHFKTLFQPKVRFDGDDPAPASNPVNDETTKGEELGRPRKYEVIIRENIPEELPPDVVRSDTKPDDGLDFVPNLSNIRLKFESPQDENPHLPSIADRSALQRSESIVARMMKYQSAVSGERTENGDVASSSEDEGERDPDVVRETKEKEKVPFSGLSSLKSQWETGAVVSNTKEEHEEEKKEVLTKLRQRICLGRSESMRAVYEKAIQESSTAKPKCSESVVLDKEINAGSIKEKFEKGEVVTEEVQEKMEKARKEKEDDLSVFEAGVTSEARSLFKQMEAASHQSPAATTPISPCKSPICSQKNKSVHSFPPVANEVDVVKCSEPLSKEDIVVETTAVQEKFKFFENFKVSPKEKKRFEMTPPREPGKAEVCNEPQPPRDPNIVRACDAVEDIVITDTAKRMLDKFKAMEKEVDHPPVPAGPKPLKRITPPREYTTTSEDHENSPERERDPDIIRASYKTEEEIVIEADKARSLKAKFENWQDEVVRENKKNEEEDYLPQADIAKNLRAKFEAIREETLKPVEKPKPKNETNGSNGELCSICNKRLYPMEKMETSGFRLHKNCFRCAYCSSLLRLENYTTSGGKLYCTPHFKQLFITKGNYDEGFGREQHKEKWNRSCSSTPTSHELKDEEMNGCTNGNSHHGENTYQEVLA